MGRDDSDSTLHVCREQPHVAASFLTTDPPAIPSLNTTGLALIAPRSSSLPFAFMGQGFSRNPPPAQTPQSSVSKGFQVARAGGNKLKRAIVNRRKKSEDASPNQPLPLTSSLSLPPTPPLPPPKPYAEPSLTLDQIPPRSQSLDAFVHMDNRSSVIPLTPGITHAVTLMCMNEIPRKEQSTQGVRSRASAENREPDGVQDQPREKPDMTAADIKDARRKSDSTMSYQTIRPGTTSNRTSRPVSMAESLQSNHTARPIRLSALITDADFSMLEEDDDDSYKPAATQDVVTMSTPPTSVLLPQKASPDASLKTKSRRSLSLNLSPYSSSKTQPPPPPLPPLPSHHPTLSLTEIKYPSYSVTEGMPPLVSPPTPSAAKEASKAVVMSVTGQTGPVPSSRLQVGQNLRGKLSSWTNPSPSERKLPASAPTPAPAPAPAPTPAPAPSQMLYPSVLSASPSHPPQALRAISMTSSLAPAAGRALRGAVGRMGRAMGISSSTSNSGSISDGQALTRTNSNQSSSAGHAYSPWGKRRTPDAPSGSWSIAPSVDSASGSDIDHLGVPSAPTLGQMLRAPFKGSGIVFGKELKDAVKDTAVGVVPSNGEGRRAGEWERSADGRARSTMHGEERPLEERRVPAVIVRCAQHLLIWGIQEEGLFRVGGRPKHTTTLRAEFDKGADYDLAVCEPGDLDPHAVASVFKAFFRELPEHMLTAVLLPYFEGIVEQETAAVAESKPRSADMTRRGPGLPSGPKAGNFPAAMKKPPSLSTLGMPSFKDLPPPSSSLIRAIRALISQLPEENQDLLRTLIDVINATAKNEKATKMPLANLVLVFYPSVQITPPLLRVLCETRGVWNEEGPAVGVKDEMDRTTSDIFVDAPDELDSTSEDHASSLSDYQASAEESIDLREEEVARRRPSPRPRRNPETTVYMDAECRCTSSASLLLHSEPSVGNVVLSNQYPNAPSPSSTPPMTSSVESLATPETSSGPSLPHLPMDENRKQDVESISDMAPESTKYIISELTPHTGPIQFPALPASLPSSPLKRRSTPLLSFPPHMSMLPSTFYEQPPSPTTSSHSNSSRRLKMKKPSLQIFLSSRRSNNSLKGVSKSGISNPLSNNDSATALPSASDSSLSTPQSAMTAPQGNAYTLPPVVKTPHDNSPLGLALGIEVKSTDTAALVMDPHLRDNDENIMTAETTKAGTPIADRYRTSSTASSRFSVALSTRSSLEQDKQSHVHPDRSRRPAISNASSNHLGLLDKELGGGDDWTRSVLLAAEIEPNWMPDGRR